MAEIVGGIDPHQANFTVGIIDRNGVCVHPSYPSQTETSKPFSHNFTKYS